MTAPRQDAQAAVRALQASGRLEEALERLQAILADRPGNMGLRLNEAALLRELGRPRDSIAILEPLVRNAPDAPWHGIHLAASLRDAGLHRRAARVLSRVIAANPDDRAALLAGVESAAREGRFDLAEAALDVAEHALPGDMALRLRRGTLLAQRGHTLAAQTHLRALTDETDSDDARLALSRQLHVSAPDEAVELAETTRRRAADKPGAWSTTIAALLNSGDIDRAEQLCRDAMDRWGDAVWLRRDRASVCSAMLDPAGALQVLGDVLQDDGFAFARGQALLRLHRTEDAAHSMDLALQREGPTPATLSGRLAVAFVVLDTPDVATRLRTAIRWHEIRGHRNGDGLRAMLSMILGDWDRVEPVAARLLDQQGPDGTLFDMLARARSALGDLDGACQAARALLRLDPHRLSALQIVANAGLARGEPVDQAQLNRDIPASGNPQRIGFALDTVQHLHLLSQHDAAHQCLDAACRMAGSRPHNGLALELLDNGKAEAAMRFHRPDGVQEASAMKRARIDASLDTLFDYDAPSIFRPSRDMPTALLAWTMTRHPEPDRTTWLRRGWHATNQRQLFGSTPPTHKALLRWVCDGALDRYLQIPPGSLLVSSHFGPLTGNVLFAVRDDVSYLANYSTFRPAVPDLGALLAATEDPRAAAAGLMRDLRRGRIICSTPDHPALYSRRGRTGGTVSGQLFGHRYDLVDTVPKLVWHRRAPSFTAQPFWRDGKFDVLIDPLPGPQPDETEAAFYGRWAQTYLDRVQWIMSASAENQNFLAPIWRYLLLQGIGRQLLAPQPGTAVPAQAL